MGSSQKKQCYDMIMSRVKAASYNAKRSNKAELTPPFGLGHNREIISREVFAHRMWREIVF